MNQLTIQIPNLPDGAKPLEMVPIPAGTFTMGTRCTEDGYAETLGQYLYSEWPAHEVTITRPFYLGKYQVTQAQWNAVMGSEKEFTFCGTGDDCPAYYVSWDDCQEFIGRLVATGQGMFRLPTEAEWEYACRAGTATLFSFGDARECDMIHDAYCELADRYMWWSGNNTDEDYAAKAVGRKLPNAWGLYDMHGNIQEWCSDFWQDIELRGPQTDPQGPNEGSERVIRGGWWNDTAFNCRSAVRRSGSWGMDFNIGLRLASTLGFYG